MRLRSRKILRFRSCMCRPHARRRRAPLLSWAASSPNWAASSPAEHSLDRPVGVLGGWPIANAELTTRDLMFGFRHDEKNLSGARVPITDRNGKHVCGCRQARRLAGLEAVDLAPMTPELVAFLSRQTRRCVISARIARASFVSLWL
jgi:hypothetical protein